MGQNTSHWKYSLCFHNRPGQHSYFWSFDGGDKGKNNGTPETGMRNVLKQLRTHLGKFNVAMIYDNKTKAFVAKFDKEGRLMSYNSAYTQFLPI